MTCRVLYEEEAHSGAQRPHLRIELMEAAGFTLDGVYKSTMTTFTHKEVHSILYVWHGPGPKTEVYYFKYQNGVTNVSLNHFMARITDQSD
jgi:hypothetical protein